MGKKTAGMQPKGMQPLLYNLLTNMITYPCISKEATVGIYVSHDFFHLHSKGGNL